MQRGFWKLFSGIVVTTSMVMGSNSTNCICIGQEKVVDDQSDKKTTEPVFRVSKLVNVSEKSNGSAGKTSNPVQEKSGGGTRVAASSNLAPNNILPGSGSAKSTPEGKARTAERELGNASPAPAEVSAKAASMAKAPATTAAPHPLDRAVETANDVLEGMRHEVRDYTAILSKREQVAGALSPTSYMNVKIRCPRTAEDGTKSPFSIYMKFLKPREAAGREVIWVDGQNESKIIAHEAGGLLGKRRFYLNPTGFMAMKGQKYPIYDAGIENLVIKLIEKAERDRAAGPCTVNYRDNGEVNRRACHVIELLHEEKREPYEFYKAQVFIDQELNLPVRYAAYDWPESPGAKPELLESFTYYNIKVNVGLTAADFDPSNKAYEYPSR